jgi:hypothetical protein
MPTVDHRVAAAAESIIRVGDRRGFVVEIRVSLGSSHLRHRAVLVITAAHCLTETMRGEPLPPRHSSSYTEERTYPILLDPLDGSPTVWSECLFVDPVADVAVLCEPDSQALSDQHDAYEQLMQGRPTLLIAKPPPPHQPCPAWVLSHAWSWAPCTARTYGWLRRLSIDRPTEAGMSGSAILTADGRAIGLINTGTIISGTPIAEQHGQASVANLPGWLFAELARRKR